MKMALLVRDSSPAVKKRTGNTHSQTGETFIHLPQRSIAPDSLSPGRVQTREKGAVLKHSLSWTQHLTQPTFTPPALVTAASNPP